MEKRVALIGENSVEYINTLLNIWNDGNCAVLIDWRIPFNIAVDMMRQASVSTCFIQQNIFNKNIVIDGDIKYIPYEVENNSAKVIPKEICDKFKENYSDDEAVVLFSSGTTGTAKGIILSHFAINTNADAVINYMELNNKDCIYIAKTLVHSSTLTGELLVGLKSKIKIIVSPTIVIPRFTLINIEKFQVTIICLNPTILSLYIDEIKRNKYTLSSLRTIYVSGSILSESLHKQAKNTFDSINIYNVYGLSEAGPRVSAQTKNYCSLGSVGKAIKNVEIIIVNEKGKIVDNNTKGTVYIKTPSHFNGYTSGINPKKSLLEGFINTGDVGYLNNNQELYILGRDDDMIIRGSHNVCPYDVKKVILECDNVKDCAVFGYPDRILGEKIICLYVAKNNQNISKKIYSHCADKLPTYEIPTEFYMIEKIPTSNNGKISKKMLVDCYEKIIESVVVK